MWILPLTIFNTMNKKHLNISSILFCIPSKQVDMLPKGGKSLNGQSSVLNLVNIMLKKKKKKTNRIAFVLTRIFNDIFRNKHNSNSKSYKNLGSKYLIWWKYFKFKKSLTTTFVRDFFGIILYKHFAFAIYIKLSQSISVNISAQLQFSHWFLDINIFA